MTERRKNNKTQPEDLAVQVTNQKIATKLFGAAILCVIFAIISIISSVSKTISIVSVVLIFATLFAFVAGTISLYYTFVHTQPARYHVVKAWPRNHVISIYGSPKGGWVQMPFWKRVQRESFYRTSTLHLTNRDFETVEIENERKLPIRISGQLTMQLFPDLASAKYRNTYISAEDMGQINNEIKLMTLAMITRIMIDTLKDKEDELNKALENDDSRMLKKGDLDNIAQLVRERLEMKEAETGIVVEWDASFMQQVFGAAVEKEITRALSTRLGFEALMDEQFSLEKFADVRAAQNTRSKRIEHKTNKGKNPPSIPSMENSRDEDIWEKANGTRSGNHKQSVSASGNQKQSPQISMESEVSKSDDEPTTSSDTSDNAVNDTYLDEIRERLSRRSDN